MFIAQKDTECFRCGSEIPIGAWFEPTDNDGDLCQECVDKMQIDADLVYDSWKEEQINY